ncbi:MAG TPA: penicillin-binding transpeptidase domain-containing protein [Clostridia bacterium]
MVSKNKKVRQRSFFLMLMYFLLMIVLIIRLGYYQIVKGEEYSRQAYYAQTRNRIINPKRGTIYDRNGQGLAISGSVETVSVNPQDFKDKFKDKPEKIDEIASALAQMLDMTDEEVKARLTENSSWAYIKRKIDKEIGNRVREYLVENGIDSICVDEDSKRFFPNGTLASHVLGFTGVDDQGLNGIEKYYDAMLNGEPGMVMVEVDAGGRQVKYSPERYIEPVDGYDIYLTIDETIQHFTEKALEKAMLDYNLKRGAAALVMDPRTGEILAMASKPDYNPNDPFAKPDFIEKEDWKGQSSSEDVELLFQTVFRNKALMDTYEPGSTFKAITSAAALEEGVVTPETEFVCNTVHMAGYNIDCWRAGGHGAETFRMGVYNSCNPVFVKTALALGIDKFYRYVRNFGFMQRTGITLNGEPDDSQYLWHKKPTELDLAVSSFGQRFTISPLQLVTAYSAIANGGYLMKPLIVKQISDSQGNIIEKYEPQVVRQVISKQTSDTLRDILEGVVAEGTGRNAYVSGYRIAGKTGTSETEQTDSEGRYIASFAAFAPADDPQVVLLVILDHPQVYPHSGGMLAAPVAGKLMEEILDYLRVEREYTEMDRKLMLKEVSVPEVRGLTLIDARKKLENYELNYIIEGEYKEDDAVIMEQTPKPNSSVPSGSTVILYTYQPEKEITVVMPDVLNKTISEAAESLRKAGLNIKVEGIGEARRQEYEPGIELNKGQVVTIWFEHTVAD